MDADTITSQQKEIPELLRLIQRSGFDCSITLPDGKRHDFGQGTPRFHVRMYSDRVLKHGLNELALAESYIRGEFDIDGDMYALLDMREHLLDRTPLSMAFKFFYDLYVRATTRVNKDSIAGHYEIDDDFYLSLVDSEYRFYS